MNVTRISPINTNIVFKSSSRYIINDDYNFMTTTSFFRSDMEWEQFFKFLEKKYAKAKNVNIIDHACSSGEEAYSLALYLISVLEEKAKKYLPIDARDFDPINISMAKKGIFDANNEEVARIQKYSGGKYGEYLDICSFSDDTNVIFTRPNIEKFVRFKKSDIFKDIEKLPAKNTVLLCRNFWPYLRIAEQKRLVKMMSKQIKSSSLVVLGTFDVYNGVDKFFEEEGFRHTELYNVMEKLPEYKIVFKKILKKLKFI